MKSILIIMCCLFFLGCESQNQFPKDVIPMVLKGKVKVMKQVSTSNAGTSFQLHETFFFDRNGNIEKVEHSTQFQDNTKEESLDQITIYKQQSDVKRIGITMKKNSADTLKIRKMELLDSYTIKIDEKQLHYNEYRSETLQKLDSSKRLKDIQTTVFEVNSDKKELTYSYSFVYDGDLVKEIIGNNNGQENSIKVRTEKMDDQGNFTYRKHINKNGEIVYTEEREYQYYEN